jgi:SpoVK/Ycf46/Vps4 family AAA+-type ATPase
MANELRDKGIEIANEAVAADNAGHYEEAITKYCKAAEYLLTATKYEKNPVTLKTIRDKCLEYTQRGETLKEGLSGKGKAKAKAQAGGGGKEEESDEEDDEIDPGPLTEEQLAAAEAEMNEALSKLIGMESVKKQMQQLCKQLSLDIRRRAEGHSTMDGIRHMMFTGNPGVGKTTVSRLVARLYKQLGVSSKDHVVEVQKGDLVAGYVNQTSMKTAKKIKEARGGILFVDEAYQLTQALQRGQSDFSGEAIDEMMKVRAQAAAPALPLPLLYAAPHLAPRCPWPAAAISLKPPLLLAHTSFHAQTLR